MAIFDVPIVWGALRLWCEAGDVEHPRALIAHEMAQGDQHPLHDPGLGARTLSLSLLFDEFAGEDLTGEARLQRLLEQHRSGRAYMLSHPLEGNFLAKIGGFRYRHDEDSVLTADVTFYQDEDDIPVSPAGAGVPAIAGQTLTAAAADELAGLVVGFDEYLVDSTLGVTDRAREVTEGWSTAEDLSTRQVMTDVAEVTNSLQDYITVNGLEDDFELFDIWLSAIKLGEAVRTAAIAATSEVDSTFTVRIAEPVVLLALCRQIYGGRNAETKERQVRQLNDLRSTAWVGPGELVMPARER